MSSTAWKFISFVCLLLLLLLILFVLCPFRLLYTVVLWAVIAAGLFTVFFIEFRGRTDTNQELARLQYDPADVSALERSIAEARETLDAQITNSNDIDTKAIRIFRINVFVIGLLLSALTFVPDTQRFQLNDFLNAYLGTGMVLLLLSTGFAGLTYTASDLRAGVSKANIATVFEEDLYDTELQVVLSKSYAKWISDNQSAEVLNSFYSTSTILLSICAVAYLLLGSYDALVGPVSPPLVIATNASLLAVTIASGYPSQVKRVLDQASPRFR